MDCPDLIAQFLQKQKSAHESVGKRKSAETSVEGEESRPKKRKDDVSPKDRSMYTDAIICLCSVTLIDCDSLCFSQRN